MKHAQEQLELCLPIPVPTRDEGDLKVRRDPRDLRVDYSVPEFLVEGFEVS